MNVIKEIFVYASIYNFQEINKTILCIFQEKNEINTIKYKLICELFLDTKQKIEVIWNKKVGIIGKKNNMKIGQFIIYWGVKNGKGNRNRFRYNKYSSVLYK